MKKKQSFYQRAQAAIALMAALMLTGCASTNEAPQPTSAPTPTQAAQSTAAPAAAAAEGSITMESANIDEADEYTDWQSGAYTEVSLSPTGYTINGPGATADESVLTISSAGTYVLTGDMPNGTVVIDASDSDEVRIVLNGASITCADGAALFVKNADKVMLSLAPDTQNAFADGASYTLYDAAEDEPNAAIFAKDDLIINGTGTLTITGNHNDGIVGNDDIKIIEGTFLINAVDDGIVGKDMVAIRTADMTIAAGGDGIKSTNETKAEKGFVAIEHGTFHITAGADGIQAATELYVAGGDFTITTGGGAESENAPKQMQSPGRQGGEIPQMPDGQPPEMLDGQLPEMPDGQFPQGQPPQGSEGIQGGQPPQPQGGRPQGAQTQGNQPQGDQSVQMQPPALPEAETSATGSYKALKAATFLTIKDGTFVIDSADDALHTNGSMAITNGTFTIASGDDGLHADQSIAIFGGDLTVSSSVEGIEGFIVEISGGTLEITAKDDGLNIAGGNDSSGTQNGRDAFAKLQGASFTISGGDITINASGDGLDTNGNGYITGGTVYISGPENNGNGALDYNGELVITGGTLVALGSTGMAMAPSDGTTQLTIAGNLASAQQAGSMLTLRDADGSIIISYPSEKTYQNVVISSPVLESGKTYTLFVDESAVQEITLSGTITTFNLQSGRGGFGRGGMGQPPTRGNAQQPNTLPGAEQSTGGDA